MPRGAFSLVTRGACDTRADRAREAQGGAEREMQVDKAGTRGRK